ncbi:MAG: protein MraZ [Chlorobi bacterium OLB4]|jgi:MraZ protein|nr:MAG: protein MraZ [Chlorobi bacterium OLB4]MBW7855005.1 division/cell wall cluster transcriptional repressor MraZ [Ignavibacteria bacterium]OQY76810.1 MAG: division/cell wall cluster transcriptional repressor MraZ [Ignavibacteriales bacterium UTCHB1]
MFQGHSILSLDNKSRFILPAKFRKFIKPEADNKLIITRGLDDCLLLYPMDEWEKLTAGLVNYNQFNPQQRNFIRQFFMYVHECELDSQNRILIPSQLIEFGKLKREIMIIGLIDKMEIWNPETKSEYDNKQDLTFEEVAEKVSEILRADN